MLPTASETQPQFAIRFHEANMDHMPDVYERNEACDSAWEQAHGPFRERQLARDTFDADKYQEVRDVAVFEEHTIPDGKDKDGNIVSGTYDKYALAEMADGINYRIRDTKQFAPLALGHTGKDKPEPQLLGFGGAIRLGMIGNENPRFGLYTDEYRRKDKSDLFRDLPGRSPEVWRNKDFSRRFMAPIACLGTTTPRLDITPTFYAHNVDGDDIPVDQYFRDDDTTFDIDEIDRYMSTMGGSNSFTPSFGGEHQDYGTQNTENSGGYSQMQNGGQDIEQLIPMLIEGFQNSQMGQFIQDLMKQSGQGGIASPMVQQPIDNPGDAMGGGAPPPQQPESPQPDGQSQFGGFPPPQPKETYEMPDNNTDYYSRMVDENAALKARLDTIDTERQRDHYARELSQLEDVAIFDTNAELARLCELSPEQGAAHIEVIRTHYQRNVTGIADFPLQFPEGTSKKEFNSEQDLGNEAAEEISSYAMEHGVDYMKARDHYIRERQNA